jgi:hypothetical protein
MRSLLLFYIFLPGLIQVNAQHCAYDLTSLIGVRPVDSKQQIIKGLRITLIDGIGQPIIINRSIYKKEQYLRSEQDTAEFWRNLPRPASGKHFQPDERKRHFIQAGDDYIILTGSRGRAEKGRLILIEDIDGAANGGPYQSEVVFADSSQVQALCGYPNGHRFNEEYRPVLVKMDGRQRKRERIFHDGFRFEFDHAPLLNCPECEGCYCQLLRVYSPQNALIFEHVIHGVDTEPRIDSMHIADFNGDSRADIHFCVDSVHDAFFVYQPEKNTFIPASQSVLKIQRKADDDHRTINVRAPFRFILEKNTPETAIPSEKGYYANKVLVFRHSDGNLLYTMVVVGNKLKESEGCADSLQIADYNLDGFPDFRICHNSRPGLHMYYVYHPLRKTFVMERTLSELHALQFDFEKLTVTGHTEQKQHPGYPWDSPYPYYREELQFEGRGLENFSLTTIPSGGGTPYTSRGKYIQQKRFYEGDSMAMEIQKHQFLRKSAGEFSFEVTFNPEDYKTQGFPGSYVKILQIYRRERLAGQYEFHGNYLKEVPHWLDSLEIADYNFDGYPDIRMYNSMSGKHQYTYLIFHPEKDKQVYYQDTYFSQMEDAEFYPKQKILKGKIRSATQIVHVFLKNDTLTLTSEQIPKNDLPFVEESIYRNGNKQVLRSAYGSLEPFAGRQFGDYNFDGHEDFRLQSKKNPAGWDVFLFHTAKQAFEKDTLMSRFETFDYNPNEKTLLGSLRFKEDELSWVTYYYCWSFEKRNMILYQTKICVSKYPGSESQRCSISTLVEGKWIDTKVWITD